MRYPVIVPGIILLFFLMTGCIPRHHVITPGATGTVIDAETKQPIPDARVETVKVNGKGKFIFPASKEWGLTFPFVGGNYPVSSFFTVSAPGYQSRTCNCTIITPDPSCDDIVIPLEKNKSTDKVENRQVIIAEGDGDPVGDNAFCAPVSTSSSWIKSYPELQVQRLEEDAQSGSSDAIYELGMRYINGDGIEKDVELGCYLIRQAAEKENPKAVEFVFNAAQQGNIEAQIFAGDMRFIGLGVELDIDKALNWYKKAAAQNSTQAMLRLAETYGVGEAVPANEINALKWYRKAADTGSAEAMFAFAEAYRYGELGPINLERAVHWWIKAADAGSMRARDMLMQTLAADDILPGIKQPALEWLKK